MQYYGPITPGPKFYAHQGQPGPSQAQVEQMRQARIAADKEQIAANSVALSQQTRGQGVGSPEMSQQQQMVLQAQLAEHRDNQGAYNQYLQNAATDAERRQGAYENDVRTDVMQNNQSVRQGERDASLQQYEMGRDWRQHQYGRESAYEQFGYHGQLNQQQAQIQQERDVRQHQFGMESQTHQVDLQAQLHQVQLTQTEAQRMQRMREAIAHVQADSSLDDNTRANLITQLQTGLDPLQARLRQSQMITDRLHQQGMQQSNEQSATLFNQRQAFLSRGAQGALQTLTDPETGATGLFHMGPDGHLTRMDFAEVSAQRAAQTALTNVQTNLGIQQGMHADEMHPLIHGQAVLRNTQLMQEVDAHPRMQALREQLLRGQVSQQYHDQQRTILANEVANRNLDQGLTPQQRAALEQHQGDAVDRAITAGTFNYSPAPAGGETAEQRNQRQQRERQAEVNRRVEGIAGALGGGGAGGPSPARWNHVQGQFQAEIAQGVQNGTLQVPQGVNPQQFIQQQAEASTRRHLGIPDRQPINLFGLRRDLTPLQQQSADELIPLRRQIAPGGLHPSQYTPEQQQAMASWERAVHLLQSNGSLDAMTPHERDEYRRLRTSINTYLNAQNSQPAAPAAPAAPAPVFGGGRRYVPEQTTIR